jgi:hypothetical protein
MKKLTKITTTLLIFVVLGTFFGLSVFATEDAPDAPFTLDDVTFTFKYTSDSVVKEGMTYQVYSDPISNQSGIELVPNFGIGYTIYDDADTEIIDGIRINGAEVTSLRIPITSDTVVREYSIAVRTVYSEGASGDLARILDGTYDYTLLLTNPIVVFQLIYWVFMAISGIVGFITLIRNKNKRVKTSDEIASKVSENADVFRERLINTVSDIVKSEVLPLAQASVKSGKEAVKAIVLSTSKSKEAPSALLDVFKESADIDIDNIVDEVREELLKSIAERAAKHDENVTTLQNIAHNVIQEDISNAKETIKSENPVKSNKSVF